MFSRILRDKQFTWLFSSGYHLLEVSTLVGVDHLLRCDHLFLQFLAKDANRRTARCCPNGKCDSVVMAILHICCCLDRVKVSIQSLDHRIADCVRFLGDEEFVHLAREWFLDQNPLIHFFVVMYHPLLEEEVERLSIT